MKLLFLAIANSLLNNSEWELKKDAPWPVTDIGGALKRTEREVARRIVELFERLTDQTFALK